MFSISILNLFAGYSQLIFIGNSVGWYGPSDRFSKDSIVAGVEFERHSKNIYIPPNIMWYKQLPGYNLHFSVSDKYNCYFKIDSIVFNISSIAKSNSILQSTLVEDIKTYKYKKELVKYVEEGMNELFNKYPETHITSEILADYKAAYLYKFSDRTHRADSLFPNCITEEYVKKFFGKMVKFEGNNAFGNQRQRGDYGIVSNKKNIYYILFGLYTSYGTPIIQLRSVKFADKKYMEHYPYRQDYPKSRLKEATTEFEAEILPKILECIEIARKRHEENGGK